MNPIVVQKYGGSSVADVAKIQRVAARIAATKQQGKEVCVVVSAMGHTTDELLSRAREISPSPSRRELDMLLTCGERASMALLSMAVSELGYQAISFTGSQSGIMTNDRHSGARIIEVRPIRVADELDRGKVVIVAGFQGVSYKREITTLGRGGSDTTAVALAAALGAEYCEICSDVDGVYSADPRVVDAARLLEAISHDEMLELATHGAKVLHADAVEFARRSDIALYARATAEDGGGTRVDRIGRIGGPAIGDADRVRAASVTGQRGLVRVALADAGAAARALAAASATKLAVMHAELPGGGAGGALWLALDDVPDWPAVKRALADALGEGAASGDNPAIAENLGAVTAVGRGIGDNPAVLSEICTSAAGAGVALLGLSAAPLRATAFCAAADVDALVRALHRALCEP